MVPPLNQRTSGITTPSDENAPDTSSDFGNKAPAMSYKELLQHHSRNRDGKLVRASAPKSLVEVQHQTRQTTASIDATVLKEHHASSKAQAPITGEDADDWRFAAQRVSTENFRSLRDALLTSGEAAASQRAEADRFCTKFRNSQREADRLRNIVSELQSSLLTKETECQRRIEAVEREAACADKGFEMLTAARTRADADLSDVRQRELAAERRGDELAEALALAQKEITQLRSEDSGLSAERLRFRLDKEHLLEELAEQRAATVAGRAELVQVQALHQDHEQRWSELEEQACARAAREAEAYTYHRLQNNVARANVSARHQELKAERACSAATRKGQSPSEPLFDHHVLSQDQNEPSRPSGLPLRSRALKKPSRMQGETGCPPKTQEFWDDWTRRSKSPSRHSHVLSRRRDVNRSMRPESAPHTNMHPEYSNMQGRASGEHDLDMNRGSIGRHVQFSSVGSESNRRFSNEDRDKTSFLSNSVTQLRLIGTSSGKHLNTSADINTSAGSSPPLATLNSNYVSSLMPDEPSSFTPAPRDGAIRGGAPSEPSCSLLDFGDERGHVLHDEMRERLQRTRRNLSSFLDGDHDIGALQGRGAER